MSNLHRNVCGFYQKQQIAMPVFIMKANNTTAYVNIWCPSLAVSKSRITVLVRLQLEYIVTLSDHTNNTNPKTLELVQRRFARFVMHIYRPTSNVRDVLRALQLDTLKQRFTLMYHIVNNLVVVETSHILHLNHKYKRPQHTSCNPHVPPAATKTCSSVPRYL